MGLGYIPPSECNLAPPTFSHMGFVRSVMVTIGINSEVAVEGAQIAAEGLGTRRLAVWYVHVLIVARGS